MKKFSFALLFSLLLTFGFTFNATEANAQGCVMCRAQVGEYKDKDEASLVGSSLNTGILYLMAIPYILIGSVGLIWYYQSRKKSS
ncbi:MAG TPA: hypothetical protein VK927_01575 [Adhaeribacter sp.]|nr:hypothetical protein [Adhaeribacter sp.]